MGTRVSVEVGYSGGSDGVGVNILGFLLRSYGRPLTLLRPNRGFCRSHYVQIKMTTKKK